MQQLKVTSSQLEELSTQVSTVAEDVASQFSTLQSKVVAAAGDWNGKAADAFQELYRDWNTGASQIQEALAGIAKLLTGAAQTYEDVETQLTSAMGR
jgi:WXG100 family type VII secretion target